LKQVANNTARGGVEEPGQVDRQTRSGEGLTEREVAARLGITQPAVQDAMALHRLMDARGVTDPYELVTTPPADDKKYCRHRSKRYRFEPLSGFPAWPDDCAMTD
jgi:hypothetical protein